MLEERAAGCLVGLACGDAVGTTLEFKRRGTFEPIEDMTGGGPFGLRPGQWTDDTSMALCLAQSLLELQDFDADDQMSRYCDWYYKGTFSSTGVCFDIGSTVRSALLNFEISGNPFSGSTDPHSAGNGAIMRLAPIPVFYLSVPERAIHYADLSTRTTHGAAECVDASRYFCALLMRAMLSDDKAAVASTAFQPEQKKIKQLHEGAFLRKHYEELTGSGYVVESLEVALWCFYHGADFRESVLLAANIGNDADTTAAVCGQICGAYYGLEGIPRAWRKKITLTAQIESTARDLFKLGQRLNGTPPQWPQTEAEMFKMGY